MCTQSLIRQYTPCPPLLQPQCGGETDSASPQQQQLSGIPENQTFAGCPSDGATSSVRRLLAETELLLRDAQAADDRSQYRATQPDLALTS